MAFSALSSWTCTNLAARLSRICQKNPDLTDNFVELLCAVFTLFSPLSHQQLSNANVVCCRYCLGCQNMFLDPYKGVSAIYLARWACGQTSMTPQNYQPDVYCHHQKKWTPIIPPPEVQAKEWEGESELFTELVLGGSRMWFQSHPRGHKLCIWPDLHIPPMPLGNLSQCNVPHCIPNPLMK